MLTPGWERLDAAVAMTTTDEAAQLILSNGQQVARTQPSAALISALRAHRHAAAGSDDGPWWRFSASLTRSGQLDVEYDYGTEPFPGSHLFPADAYRADLQTYPRRRLPTWLAAYIGHDGRQSRTPALAFSRAMAEASAGIRPAPTDELPPLPLLWSRWAVISTAFVATGSDVGPRVSVALGWFEGSTHGGSTLYLLPEGRAVLSGGVLNAPALDAAYNDGAPLPQLYLGAPDWVADPVLNPRIANGLLSFCYWWDGSSWYHGESPAAATVISALPGIWSSDTAVDVIDRVIGEGGQRSAAAELVHAAEAGAVPRSLLAKTFGDRAMEIDEAFFQLKLAGVADREPTGLE